MWRKLRCNVQQVKFPHAGKISKYFTAGNQCEIRLLNTTFSKMYISFFIVLLSSLAK